MKILRNSNNAGQGSALDIFLQALHPQAADPVEKVAQASAPADFSHLMATDPKRKASWPTDNRTYRPIVPSDPKKRKPSEYGWYSGETEESLTKEMKSRDKQQFIGHKVEVYRNAKMGGFIVRLHGGPMETMIDSGPEMAVLLTDVDFWIDDDIRTTVHAFMVGTLAGFDSSPTGEKVSYDPYQHRFFEKGSNKSIAKADQCCVTQRGIWASGLKDKEGRPVGQLSGNAVASANRHGFSMGSTGWAGGNMDDMLNRLGHKDRELDPNDPHDWG